MVQKEIVQKGLEILEKVLIIVVWCYKYHCKRT